MKKNIYSIIMSILFGLIVVGSACAQSDETEQSVYSSYSVYSSQSVEESIVENNIQSQSISENIAQSLSSEEESLEQDCSSEEYSSEEESSVKEPVRHYPYQLGDDVEDFTIVLSDGSRLTLSEVLKDKKMVIIKFWATWCEPCVREWPALTEAYEGYEDDVLILCVSVTDSNAVVQSYKQDNDLPFAFAADSLGLVNEFGVGAIPYKFIIDQNGVLAESHLGAVTSVDAYTALFDKYCN